MRLSKLDGLRGLFSFLIVFFHYPGNFRPVWMESFMIRNSYVFVDFFFILSGFVISLNYISLNSKADITQYLKKRFVRIYPLLLYSVLLLFIVKVFFNFLSRKVGLEYFPQFFSNSRGYEFNEDFIIPLIKTLDSLMLTNSTPLFFYNDPTQLGMNYPSWSISSEMISYLYFIVLIILVSKYKTQIFPITVLLGGFLFMMNYGDFFNGGHFGFIRGIIGFTLGYFVYKVYSFKRVKHINNSAELLIVPLVIWSVYMIPESGMGSFSIDYVWKVVLLLFAFGGTLLLLTKTDGFLSKILEHSFLQYLGKISYSVYLNHSLVFFLMGKSLKIIKYGESEIEKNLMAILISTILILYSFLTYKLVEKRVGNLLSKKIFKFK